MVENMQTQYVPVAPTFDGTPHVAIPRPRPNRWRIVAIASIVALALSLVGGWLAYSGKAHDLDASKAYAAAQVTALGKTQDALQHSKAEVGNLSASVQTLNGDLDTTQARLDDATSAGQACHDAAEFFARYINGVYPGTGVTRATINECEAFYGRGPVNA